MYNTAIVLSSDSYDYTLQQVPWCDDEFHCLQEKDNRIENIICQRRQQKIGNVQQKVSLQFDM